MFNGEFTPKELRQAEQIIREMRDHNIKDDDLFSHNIEETKRVREQATLNAREERKGRTGSSRRERRENISPGKRRSGESIDTFRKKEKLFLAPGEGEIVYGLKCVCGGDIYIEALCSKTAIKNKCVRIGYCVECNTEVKIR
jgi:hypothetical protein